MRRTVLLALGLIAAFPAQAETLRIAHYTPARSDQVAALRTIHVESLGGDAGSALAIAIEENLRRIDLGKGPWFRVVPAALSTGGGDALLRGGGDLEMRRSDYTEQRERCIKDDAGKCTDAKEKYTVPCVRRLYELSSTLRLIDREGAILWSDESTEPLEEKRCADASGEPRGVRAVERMLVGRLALKVQNEFAPRRDLIEVRVDENRKGLVKEDADAFRAAVRLVKDKREPEACLAWTALGQRYPDHVPTQFNIGLCAESMMQDGEAQARYRAVKGLNPRSAPADEGLGRLSDRTRALRQIEARFGP